MVMVPIATYLFWTNKFFFYMYLVLWGLQTLGALIGGYDKIEVALFGKTKADPKAIYPYW